jgi:hypothetical protein
MSNAARMLTRHPATDDLAANGDASRNLEPLPAEKSRIERCSVHLALS